MICRHCEKRIPSARAKLIEQSKQKAKIKGEVVTPMEETCVECLEKKEELDQEIAEIQKKKQPGARKSPVTRRRSHLCDYTSVKR